MSPLKYIIYMLFYQTAMINVKKRSVEFENLIDILKQIAYNGEA